MTLGTQILCSIDCLLVLLHLHKVALRRSVTEASVGDTFLDVEPPDLARRSLTTHAGQTECSPTAFGSSETGADGCHRPSQSGRIGLSPPQDRGRRANAMLLCHRRVHAVIAMRQPRLQRPTHASVLQQVNGRRASDQSAREGRNG
jgi:hypothetical protein